MELLKFQEKVVRKGLKVLNDKNSFFFQSPTGSGKTFIVFKLIDEFIFKSELNWSILFFSPNNLSTQHKNKIEEIQNNASSINNFNLYLNEESMTSFGVFQRKSIYLFDWEKFVKENNKYGFKSSSGEKKNKFRDVLERTIDDETNLLIVIDEAHLNFTNKRDFNKLTETEKFIDFIKNKSKNILLKIVKMSATLTFSKNKEIDYEIILNDVKEEGLIKNYLVVNDDLETDTKKLSIDEDILELGIKKHKKLRSKYLDKGITPLTLIQISNKDDKNNINLSMNDVKDVLKRENIDNFKVGIYLTDRKEDLNGYRLSKESISKNNSKIEFLIFKQSLSTGWNSPRAFNLIKLRTTKSKSFSIQTLGRIRRNPFFSQEIEDDLNTSFLYIGAKELNSENIVGGTSEERNEILIPKSKVNTRKEYNEEKKNNFIFLNKLIKKRFNKDLERKILNSFFKKYEEKINLINDEEIIYFEEFINRKQNIDKYLNKEERVNVSKKEFKFTLKTLYKYCFSLIKEKEIIDLIDLICRGNKEPKYIYFWFYKNYQKEKEGILNIIFNSLKINNYYEKFYIGRNTSKIIFKEENIILEGKKDLDFANIFKYSVSHTVKKNFNLWEYKLWEKINNKKDINPEIWIYRNGTNPNDDYYIEYSNGLNYKSKFFPDFIISTNDKILIVDTKSERDPQFINKIRNLTLNDLILNKPIEFYYCDLRDGELFFKNVKNINENKLLDLDDILS